MAPTAVGESRRGKSVAEMLADYKSKREFGHTAKDNKKLELQKLLAARSAHLPGYSWCADWVQWMRNNHPLLALCCRYRENPVGIGQRVVIITGSVAFGLAATNLVYLFYKIYPDANGVVLQITTGSEASGSKPFVLTYETVALWTLGSVLHSLIDLGAWHLTACACCMPGSCCSCCGWLRSVGPYVAISMAGSFVALASAAVIMRANFEKSDGQSVGTTDLDFNFESFSFLQGYFIELFLVWFLYYPIMATVFFSGALRTFSFNLIGGRPKEIDRQQEEKRKQEIENFENNPYIEP